MPLNWTIYWAALCFAALLLKHHVASAISMHESIASESMLLRDGFNFHSKPANNTLHELIFAVKQLNLDIIEKELLDRSTPGSQNYQKWLSFEDIGSLIKNDEAYDALTAWLSSHSIKMTWESKRREYVKAIASVEKWNQLLRGNFLNFIDENPNSGTNGIVAIRTRKYVMPRELVGHIDSIFNTVQPLPLIHKRFRSENGTAFRVDSNFMLSDKGNSEDDANFNPVTVEYLNGYYEIPTNPSPAPTAQPSSCDDVPCPTSCSVGYSRYWTLSSGCKVYCTEEPTGNQCESGGSGCTSSCVSSSDLEQAVFEYGNNAFSQQDLQQFQEKYDLFVQAAEVVGTESLPADECSNSECSEGNLDIQYIMGISPHTISVFYYVAGSNMGDAFVTFVTNLADDSDPPKVVSISYGSNENTLPTSTLNSFNSEAMKLGAIGITVLAATGDGGVSGVACACTSNSGSSQTSWAGGGTWTGEGYFPIFPASNPYITAIGATMGTGGNAPTSRGDEIVCQTELNGEMVSYITTGGGFSTYFPQPAFQQSLVSKYFSNLSVNPQPGFNKNGRAYPDMSFIGVWYSIIVNGTLIYDTGTSCSSPFAAGMISVINAKRATVGLPTVGYINPTLYANPASFNDITSGSNNCCKYSGQNPVTCCASGFSAATGWDPASGLGSVDFGNLVSMLDSITI